MAFVTVFDTFNPGEADLVRSRLEAAGFVVYVAHELSALSLEGYSVAAGGILVQVAEEEVAAAKALLDAAPETPPAP
jgi:hypothetical protein